MILWKSLVTVLEQNMDDVIWLHLSFKYFPEVTCIFS